jgi:hypothetical protein
MSELDPIANPEIVHTMRGYYCDRWMYIVDGVAVDFYIQGHGDPIDSRRTGPDPVMLDYLDEHGFTFKPRG